MLISVQAAKKATAFDGDLKTFKRSALLVNYCIREKRIVAIGHPSHMAGPYFKKYFEYLVRQTLDHLSKVRSAVSADELKLFKGCKKTFKILWEFGVIGEIRNVHETIKNSSNNDAKPETSITITQVYEVAQAVLNFDGSEAAFKRQIQRLYGSFAEYCIEKGYDINSTNWENDETAIRVARKLGSIEEVKRRSNSLFKYLAEKKLLKVVFAKEVA